MKGIDGIKIQSFLDHGLDGLETEQEFGAAYVELFALVELCREGVRGATDREVGKLETLRELAIQAWEKCMESNL